MLQVRWKQPCYFKRSDSWYVEMERLDAGQFTVNGCCIRLHTDVGAGAYTCLFLHYNKPDTPERFPQTAVPNYFTYGQGWVPMKSASVCMKKCQAKACVGKCHSRLADFIGFRTCPYVLWVCRLREVVR